MSEREGVIKFRAEHRREALPSRRYGDLACALVAWREIFAKTGLVGQDPTRYDGYGFGNVSGRVGPPGAPRRQRAFLITGTQTSGRPCMTLDDFCLVTSCDPAHNAVSSAGLSLPSSEAMTHGAIYALAPHIRFVFHAHSPTIWRRARALRLPTTDPAVAYGTVAMAREVERLWTASPLAELGILAMGGHEDGIVCFGRSAEEAGTVMIRALARAYAGQCAEGDGSLCGRD